MTPSPSRDVPRRTLLVTAGAGLASFGSGCLGDPPTDLKPDKVSSESDALSPAERWIPTTDRSAALQFTHCDLETMRAHLNADVVDELSPIGGDVEGRLVEAAAIDGEASLGFDLSFGPANGRTGRVISGPFDPDAIADRLEFDDERDAFDIGQSDRITMAVSAKTIVFAADRSKLDAILAAGLDGTDRRVDDDDAFETLLETVADGTYTVGRIDGENDGSDDDPFGTAASGYSWAIDPDRSTLTLAAIDDDTDGPGAERLADVVDRTGLERRFRNPTIESEGRVAVATAEQGTDEFERRDLRLQSDDGPNEAVRAGVTIDVDENAREITVEFVSGGDAERIAIRDDGERRGELTDVASRETFEYEAGAEGEIVAVAVAGDRSTVVAVEPYAF